jgi:hypothetical protein
MLRSILVGGGSVRLDVGVVDVAKAEPTTVFDRDCLTVTALGIPHGNMPTLAYRVKARNVSMCEPPDHASGSCRRREEYPLHAAPAVVGRIAQQAGIGRLIVSHIGLFDLEAAIADLRKFYDGPLIVGADMQCTPVQ